MQLYPGICLAAYMSSNCLHVNTHCHLIHSTTAEALEQLCIPGMSRAVFVCQGGCLEGVNGCFWKAWRDRRPDWIALGNQLCLLSCLTDRVPTLPAVGLGRQNAFPPAPTPATGQAPAPAAAACSHSPLKEAAKKHEALVRRAVEAVANVRVHSNSNCSPLPPAFSTVERDLSNWPYVLHQDRAAALSSTHLVSRGVAWGPAPCRCTGSAASWRERAQ